VNHKFNASFGIKKAGADPADQKFYIEGYASNGDRDSYGDRISAEAMKQLTEMLVGKTVLHNHDPNQEVGKVLESKVDEELNAAWVKCVILDADIQKKIQDGLIDGFSIHAIACDFVVHSTADEHWCEITGWERVVELTVTAIPAQEKARVLGWYIKAFLKSVQQGDAEKLRAVIKAELAALTPPTVDVDALAQKLAAALGPVRKAVSADELAKFCKDQAAALSGIAISAETVDAVKEAVATVAAALQAKANELLAAGEGEGETQAGVKALAASIAALEGRLKDVGDAVARLPAVVQEEVGKVRKSVNLSGQPPAEPPEAPKKAFESWGGYVFRAKEGADQ
jgi:phage head maturation protease